MKGRTHRNATGENLVHFDFVAVRFYTLLFVYVAANLAITCAKAASITARHMHAQKGNPVVNRVLAIFGAKDMRQWSTRLRLGTRFDTFELFVMIYILCMTHYFGRVEVTNIMALSNLQSVSVFGHSAASVSMLFNPVLNALVLVVVTASVFFVALIFGFLFDLLIVGHFNDASRCPGCNLNVKIAWMTMVNVIALISGVGVRSVVFLFITPRGLMTSILIAPMTWLVLTLISYAMLKLRTWMLCGVIKGSSRAINTTAMTNMSSVALVAIIALLMRGG